MPVRFLCTFQKLRKHDCDRSSRMCELARVCASESTLLWMDQSRVSGRRQREFQSQSNYVTNYRDLKARLLHSGSFFIRWCQNYDEWFHANLLLFLDCSFGKDQLHFRSSSSGWISTVPSAFNSGQFMIQNLRQKANENRIFWQQQRPTGIQNHITYQTIHPFNCPPTCD